MESTWSAVINLTSRARELRSAPTGPKRTKLSDSKRDARGKSDVGVFQ